MPQHLTKYVNENLLHRLCVSSRLSQQSISESSAKQWLWKLGVTPVTHHPPHTHVGPVSEPITSYGYDQMSTRSRLIAGRNGFPW